MNIVDKARKFAERAHRGQVRKYTGEPYFVHLDEVAKLCARYGLSKRACAAAYLHDTVEDQPVTHEQLVMEFGKDIADIVRDLTDEPTSNRTNRLQRNRMNLDRLAKAGAEAQSIKCADMVSNTASIARHRGRDRAGYHRRGTHKMTVDIRLITKLSDCPILATQAYAVASQGSCHGPQRNRYGARGCATAGRRTPNRDRRGRHSCDRTDLRYRRGRACRDGRDVLQHATQECGR